MTDSELLNELKLQAEVFILSASDNTELEQYAFTLEELKVFLMMFADGAITQLQRNNELELKQ